MSPKLKAIIFDLDGVLVDSEVLWSEGRNKMMKPFGQKYSLEDKKSTMGGDYRAGIRLIIKRYNLPLTVAEFIIKEKKIMDEMYRKKLKLMNGVKKLIQEIDNFGIDRAIATSSSRQRLELAKSVVGLRGFNAEVTGDEINNGKPAPDIFLKAADKLKIEYANCVVLEDSRYGIKGAKAAGMKAVAVFDDRFMDERVYTGQYKADLIVDSMIKLKVSVLEGLFS